MPDRSCRTTKVSAGEGVPRDAEWIEKKACENDGCRDGKCLHWEEDGVKSLRR